MPDTQNPVSPTNSAKGEWIKIYQSYEAQNDDGIIIDDSHVSVDMDVLRSSTVGCSPASPALPTAADTEVFLAAAHETIPADALQQVERDGRRGDDIPARSSVVYDDEIPRATDTPATSILPANGEHEHMSSRYEDETAQEQSPTPVDLDGNRHRCVDGHKHEHKGKHEHEDEHPFHRQREMNDGIWADIPPSSPSARIVKVLTQGLGSVHPLPNAPLAAPPSPPPRFPAAAPPESASTLPQFKAYQSPTPRSPSAPRASKSALADLKDQAHLGNQAFDWDQLLPHQRLHINSWLKPHRRCLRNGIHRAVFPS